MPEVDLQAVAAAQSAPNSEKPAENQQVPPPAAPSTPAPAAAKQPASTPAPVDSQGRAFDPLLHETTEDGRPVFRTDGVTLKCRRTPLKELKTASRVGEAPQADTAPAGDQAAAQAAPASAEPVDPEKAKRMREAGAKTCAGIQILIMRKSLGEHIAATDSDQAALAACWEDMFDYYGMERMHPVLGLAVVTGMITFDGMKEKETRSAINRAWLWCKVKVGGAFLWMTGRRRQPATELKPDDQAAPAT